jgi:heme/copper-type cytochrome/quinol oxidase subunit 4
MQSSAIRIISAILFLLFFSFAALQYNDPDPVVWIAIYLAIGLPSFLHMINRPSKKVAMVVLIGTCAIALFYLPGFYEWLTRPDKAEIFGEMVYEKPYIEETREFLGLVIGAVALLFQYRKA